MDLSLLLDELLEILWGLEAVEQPVPEEVHRTYVGRAIPQPS